MLLAGRWTFDSLNELESALRYGGVWDRVRESAARVGRTFPEAPPTSDQLRHLRDRARDGMADELARAPTRPAVALAQQAGLLDAGAVVNWEQPARENSIYGDGSTFRTLSDVHVDDDASYTGPARANRPSRAIEGPAWRRPTPAKRAVACSSP